MQHIETVTYGSPCGDMVLGAIGGKLCLCDWIVEKHSELVASRLRRMLGAQMVNSPSDTTRETIRQLDQYFSRSLREFHLPLLFAGTDFQVAVWRELLAIPYGQTATYGQLAQRIGRPPGSARCGQCQRSQRDVDHCAVSQGDRPRRPSRGLCRRHGGKTVSARSGDNIIMYNRSKCSMAHIARA